MRSSSGQSSSLQKLLEDGPVTFLKVQEDDFILEVVERNESQTHAMIRAGNIPAILKKLKHEPAEAADLEAAIADIEDQLMPCIKKLPKQRCLVTSEPQFWGIGGVAGIDPEDGFQLEIDTVEEIFNRLVDVAYGMPAARLNVPENSGFAAHVLFLRELMHHAGFNAIHLIRQMEME